jgi:SWI/SNF-related matrix-associated actin-dependent regulator 1 of chromatin subfamily A
VRPRRRARSAASLPASDGARRAPAAKKRRTVRIDSDASDEEEEEAVTDSDGDTPAPKARPASQGGAAGEAGDGEGDGGEDAEAAEEEGGSDGGGSSADEEELYGDTLEECGRIAAGLRSALGAAGSAERVAATDAGGSDALRLVSAAQVRAACTEDAPAAKAAACPELKGYQLVGVNFLLLLHKQGVEGAILADEMGCVPSHSSRTSCCRSHAWAVGRTQ